jgi:hypothetical protein
MIMNTFLLTTVGLVILLAGFVTYSATTHSAAVTEQAQPGVVANAKLMIADEPAVRMQSGAIELSDGNYPDFRPHMKPALKQGVAFECISAEENAQPRRWGGCIQ